VENPHGLTFKIKVSKSEITKRFLAYLGFSYNRLTNYVFTTPITKVRSFDEAKVCGGGIILENLYQNFEVKSVP
jgi:predicted flavoprotein YhiN